MLLLAGGGAALLLAFRKAAGAAELPAGPRRLSLLGDSITANGGYARRLREILPAGSVVDVFGVVGEGAKAAHRRLPAIAGWGI